LNLGLSLIHFRLFQAEKYLLSNHFRFHLA
jgi:hypothetical protein